MREPPSRRRADRPNARPLGLRPPTPGGSCLVSARGTGRPGPTSAPHTGRWSTTWTCWTTWHAKAAAGAGRARPRVLKLAAEPSAAHTRFLWPRLHRAGARRIGPDALLAVEHKVAFGDPISTRAVGREAIQVHL